MAPKRRPPVVVKPQPSARKQRKKRLPESSSDKDSEAEETAVVVAESEPEAEDKASDNQEIFSETKESSTQYVQHVFQRPLRGHTATMDRDKQARVLAEKGKKAGPLRLCCSQNKSAADQPHRKDYQQEPFVPQTRNARGEESWFDKNRTASKTRR